LIETKYSQYGNNLLIQPYVEEVVKRIRQELLEDEEMAKVMKKNPQMFTVNAAWRTKPNQAEKFKEALVEAKKDLDAEYEEAKKKGVKIKNPKTGKEEDVQPPTKEAIKKRAKQFVAEISSHHTGATLDWYLGFPIKRQYIPSYLKSKAYKKIKPLLQKYKMAPYALEPWHWECSSLCKKNIEDILAKEKLQDVMSETETNDDDASDFEKESMRGYPHDYGYQTRVNHFSSLGDSLVALGENPLPIQEEVSIDDIEFDMTGQKSSETEDICTIGAMQQILLEQKIKEENLALSRRNKMLVGIGIAAISATILGVWLYNKKKNQS